MIRIKINLSKVDESAVFIGKNGARYLDLTVMENRNGPDQYGNDYMVTQDIGRERRLNGERGPILGNGKSGVMTRKPDSAPPQRQADDGDSY
jgi:hypothetical protein